jgi:hypothetical protein
MCLSEDHTTRLRLILVGTSMEVIVSIDPISFIISIQSSLVIGSGSKSVFR